MSFRIFFQKWLIENKPQLARPDRYPNTITTISNHFKKSFNKAINLYEIRNLKDLLLLKDEYFSNDEFFQKNKRGNRMYSRSWDLYIEFFVTNEGKLDDTLDQINQINNDKTLTNLEKESLILSRIGQGKFRDQLIDLWKGCAISKFEDSKFLIASHIKPWKKSTNQEKIDKYNGLLLLPTYDKLFDLGFISFDDNGKIIISKLLNSFEKLGIDNNIMIDVKNNNKKYLKYHREKLLKE
ncbi:HNH endonuclease [Chryseobacterium sp.]|uniref:HNH endonuclease n=1 Tax=Chryseobacterium sp. TaxID=1871047 RepID=UPI000EEA73FB|nr:HNH endonuclease [Chryseobacterium sp.]HCA09642.1 hypothetical protein [Chryseobacterium sp.]